MVSMTLGERDESMAQFKIALAIFWGVLLCAGLTAYASAYCLKRPALKRAGAFLLGGWFLYDFVLIILAFTFGWFS